jgi:hypothetical protein
MPDLRSGFCGLQRLWRCAQYRQHRATRGTHATAGHADHRARVNQPYFPAALVGYFQPVRDYLFDAYREITAIDPGFTERRELWAHIWVPRCGHRRRLQALRGAASWRDLPTQFGSTGRRANGAAIRGCLIVRRWGSRLPLFVSQPFSEHTP